MSFEEFQKQNPHYSYLVAKIHYNIIQEKKAPDLFLHLNTSPSNDEEICESCSA